MSTTENSSKLQQFADNLHLSFNESEYNVINEIATADNKADKQLQQLIAKVKQQQLDNCYNNPTTSTLMSAAAAGLINEIATSETANILGKQFAAASDNKQAADKAVATYKGKDKKQIATLAAAADKAASEYSELKQKVESKQKAIAENLLTLSTKDFNGEPRFYNYTNKQFVALTTKQIAMSWAVALWKEYIRTRKDVSSSKQRATISEKITSKVKTFAAFITDDKELVTAVAAVVKGCNLDDVKQAVAEYKQQQAATTATTANK